MENWFEELFLKRKRFDESVRENNFEKGIRRSTVEKYADPVHFVYELLQNAEDQGATKAQFALSSRALAFRHNGHPFSRSDVENITGIGNSNKPQEANKIGRFGIGFKSIFAITDRPEIHTLVEKSRFAFAIEHLVVPVALPVDHEHNWSYQTHFLFPFIKGQEETLYAKIEERLSTLGFEALLFLQNLTTLEWQTESHHGIYQHEIHGEQHTFSRENSQHGQHQQKSTNYLLFTRKVHLSERDLDVRLAFNLNEEGKVRAEPGQKLAVYFPTEQETGLQFRIHGPFLLTDNRANIKSDNATNSRLIDECALLLGESIQRIKEAGLLTIDFLSLLPIRSDIAAPFMPLYYRVREVLKQQPFLPTADGTFVSATQGKLARGHGLRDLLNSQQLSSLYGVPFPLHWLSSEITDDKVPDLYWYVTKSLNVEVISPESLVRKLERPFLEHQTDAWLVKLYTFLSHQYSLDTIIKERPILRLEDNSQVSPFKRLSYQGDESPNAYLPPKGHGQSRFPLIKKVLLIDDTIFTFLRRIGLSEPDVVDEVLEFILPLYAAGTVALDNQERNSQDLEDIQKALQQKDHPARQRLLKALHDTSFLQARNAKTSEKAWKKSQEVYFRTEELSLWFNGNEEAWFLIEPFPADLLKDLRISRQLCMNSRTTTGNTGYVTIRTWQPHQRGLHGFDPDAQLEGLQHVLDHITFERALLLWKFLPEHRHLIKGLIETSHYHNFTDAQRTEQFSHMGKLCSQKSWLPDEDRNFYAPDDLFLAELPEGFETNTIEAQEVAQKLGMKRTEMLELADKLDIPTEAILLIQKNPDAFRAWCIEQQKLFLPSSITSDPEGRKARAAEIAYASRGKIYRSVTTHKRTSASYSEARAYLSNHHRNRDGQLICQLCDQRMPFRLPQGDEFFVACQYIESVEKEYCANYLALCPNCAAEFRYACQTPRREKADRLFAVKITTNEKTLLVPLDMPVHQHLRFTHRHLIDLQMATKDWLETASDPWSSFRDLDPYDLL